MLFQALKEMFVPLLVVWKTPSDLFRSLKCAQEAGGTCLLGAFQQREKAQLEPSVLLEAQAPPSLLSKGRMVGAVHQR